MTAAKDRNQLLMRTMTSMGFQPIAEVDPNYLEFFKDYAEVGGRVARCRALFRKAGLTPDLTQATLESFVITVQGTVAAMPEEISTKAPRVMHADMLHILQTAEGVSLEAAGTISHDAKIPQCVDCQEPAEGGYLDTPRGVVCLRCLDD